MVPGSILCWIGLDFNGEETVKNQLFQAVIQSICTVYREFLRAGERVQIDWLLGYGKYRARHLCVSEKCLRTKSRRLTPELQFPSQQHGPSIMR